MQAADGQKKGSSILKTRKKLADILANPEREKLGKIWDSTKAAADQNALPSGEYLCGVASGDLFKSQSGTPGYRLKLVVLQGEHIDRVMWHDVWLSPAALPMTKRDLGKLGITSSEQLDLPLPEGIVVTAKGGAPKGR